MLVERGLEREGNRSVFWKGQDQNLRAHRLAAHEREAEQLRNNFRQERRYNPLGYWGEEWADHRLLIPQDETLLLHG